MNMINSGMRLFCLQLEASCLSDMQKSDVTAPEMNSPRDPSRQKRPYGNRSKKSPIRIAAPESKFQDNVCHVIFTSRRPKAIVQKRCNVIVWDRWH